ncbi:FAD-dependent oxidoreductase [Candidatus Pacebacteria bacterium]|nr:FAD-dependent oxidoreductase [Candidatus Paceibacterota bacterium]
METKHVDVLVIGSGTAGSNAARAATAAGAKEVVMVHEPGLINTCIEEGCMPSKSVLAGAHQGEPLEEVLEKRNAHIDRLLKALLEGLKDEAFTMIEGTASFIDDHTVAVTNNSETEQYSADGIVLATGTSAFVPPIEGLDTLGDKMLLSEDVVTKAANFSKVPKRLLVIGGGPIGLEMATFFHDMGSEVDVFERTRALGAYDPEIGEERVRASQAERSFPIHLKANLQKTECKDDQVLCTVEQNGEVRAEMYDAVLIATGRHANTAGLKLENTSLDIDEKGRIIHQETTLETSVPHIFVAGDVSGHHQILHYAAAMGKTAGTNATLPEQQATIDYDLLTLAVSFDQFQSALAGLTETEAKARDLDVITATRKFNSIGLGILKRQEYGLWKLVAEKHSGRIIGSQIIGPDSAGELIQLLVPIMHNKNTWADILDMTWYHPTYAEIIKSLARDLEKQCD